MFLGLASLEIGIYTGIFFYHTDKRYLQMAWLLHMCLVGWQFSLLSPVRTRLSEIVLGLGHHTTQVQHIQQRAWSLNNTFGQCLSDWLYTFPNSQTEESLMNSFHNVLSMGLPGKVHITVYGNAMLILWKSKNL